MTESHSTYAFDTKAVHAAMTDIRETGAHVPVLDRSTTNPVPSAQNAGESLANMATGAKPAAGDSAVYQRAWNPMVARFEDGLAALERMPEAVAYGSGMAAVSAALLAMKMGEKTHVVGIRPIYGTTDALFDSGLLGTTVTWVEHASEVTAAITPMTGLVIMESPTNPMTSLINIAEVVEAAGDVPVMVDNTFATPVLQQPAAHGATLVLHSATKYIGGHGDAMGGVIATNEDWAARLRVVRILTGGVMSPDTAYMMHRGLRTLPVRVRAAQENAIQIADWFARQDGIEAVHYPGLSNDPIVGTQMAGPGAMMCLDFGSAEKSAAFCEAVQLAQHAVSLGGVDTLVESPANLTHQVVVEDARPGAGLVRISVGLEDPADIIADFEQALQAAAKIGA